MSKQNELVGRLTSRKFWLTVGAFITLAANSQWPEAMGAIIAYVSANGVIEAAEKYNQGER